MSSPPTSALRDELTSALGPKSDVYWDTLSQYLCGQLSRAEFNEVIRVSVDTPHLVQLHNALIISVLGSSSHHAPPTPPPDGPSKGKPLRKRRRTLPYQGADAAADQDTLRSPRLKRWTVGMGRRERERVRALQVQTDADGSVADKDPPKPRKERDEIARERGVILIPEGKDPPGTYLPIHLASVTRGPTLQHISERIALISAQHNLGPPPRSVSSLMMLAYQAKIKQIITQALVLTSSSHAITSIQLSNSSASRAQPLSASAFDTLFALRPAVLPTQSAAAMRLALGENDGCDHEVHLKERHFEDPRWQILAMLAERSTVREALLASR